MQKSHFCFVVGLLLTGTYLLPHAILGEDAHIRIFDSLEPNLGLQAHLAKTGSADCMLGGLPPAATIAIPRVVLLFHRFLPPREAYLAWDCAVRFIAYVGMFVLLKQLQALHDAPGLATVTAVSFAWLPHFSVFGLAVAGLPALMSSCLVLTDSDQPARVKLWSAAIIAAFPFTAFVAVLPFVAALLGLAALICLVRRDRTGTWLVGCLLFFVFSTLIANWSYVSTMLMSPPVAWHRDEFVSRGITIHEIVTRTFSHYHVDTCSRRILWPALIACVVMAARNVAGESYRWYAAVLPLGLIPLILYSTTDRFELAGFGFAVAATALIPDTRVVRGLRPSLIACALFVFFVALFWILLSRGLRVYLPLKGFNYTRWYFLMPPVLYVTFFFVLAQLRSIRRVGALAAWTVAILQLGSIIQAADWYRGLIDKELSYRDYVSANTFDLAAELTGGARSDYRIACVGFYPSRAHLNGFMTVGGYWNLYPAAQKHAMRNVISQELARSEKLRRYFEDWGNRCYVYSADIGHHHDIAVHHLSVESIALHIDTAELQKMGTDFLFSARPVRNATETGLTLLGSTGQVNRDNAGLTIWVYALQE